MSDPLSDPRVLNILKLPGEDEDILRTSLDRFRRGDLSLTRDSAGEAAIKAIQRLLVFLGYSTASTGAFLIDGDFGRGTNRAVAQFQFEHGLSGPLGRATLCYACSWQNAAANIVEIPDATLTAETLDRMVDRAIEMIEQKSLMCGDLDAALFHLNALHQRRSLSCREIFERYRSLVDAAIASVAREGIGIAPEWVYSIVKQETGGVVRPRFEQHVLTRLNNALSTEEFAELRHRSMSMGVGQILGTNFETVGAASARAVFSASLTQQFEHVARFLSANRNIASVVSRPPGNTDDFRAVARYYNGSGYEKHHYHESLESWYREFRLLTAA